MLRKFRNNSEDRVQREIRAVVGRHEAELHEKVRIADIIDIGKLDRRETGTYALQAHFDFVLIDDRREAVVAIEFDGAGHDPKNDEKKNSICRQADLPLIRIHSFEQVRETNAITLARYLVELVFHARAFLRMQAQGQISAEEPFMLSAFIRSDAKHIFDSEFDFVANANTKLTKALQRSGLAGDSLPHLSISRLTVRAPDGELGAYLSINSKKGPIIGAARLRVTLASAGFLAEIGTVTTEIAEFAYGMAADELLENIRLVSEGQMHMVDDAAAVLAEIKMLGSQGYEFVMGGGGSLSDANLLRAFTDGNGGSLFRRVK
jgi:hypothetical protein